MTEFDGNEGLWDAVKGSHSPMRVLNQEQAGNENLSALVTFCPLYQPGDLATSQLMAAPAKIGESRVAGKWQALQSVLGAMASYQHKTGKELSVTAVFANRGVLLGTEPTAADVERLAHHGEVYQKAISAFCADSGVACDFTDYEELDVPISQFVNPGEAIPDSDSATSFQIGSPGYVLDALNSYAKKLNLPTQLTQNRDTRRKIGDLTKSFGPETAFWLTAGYLAFDYKIPELVGEGGVYLGTERFAPIFRIATLTPGLRSMARVEISA